MTPRLRFAPSPTGQLHVGNARTALFNWLLARGSGGAFVLRVEDTDAERSTIESERAILHDLRWLGLDWDEGPDKDGGVGPYRQSERLDHYRRAVGALTAGGRAYSCFCSPEQLDAARKAALEGGAPPKYNGRCRSLGPDDARRRIEAGEQAATRFLIGDDVRDVTFTDLVRGDVTVSTSIIGDPVIVRADGTPAYNFAVVVDDAAMAITHVVRGEDHLSNTPRQILIYEALGLTPPAFAHLSLVLGPDHAPLSKRHGATSVAEFRARGYLPDALVNYLALLGWSPGEDEEIVPLVEMARRFDVGRVSHSAAVFDVDKLSWVNRHYMKAATAEQLVATAWPYFEAAGFVTARTAEAEAYLRSLVPLAVASVDRLEEMPSRLRVVLAWDSAKATDAVRLEPDGVRLAEALAQVLADSAPLADRDAFRAAAARVRDITGLKGKALFHPIRVVLTGEASGPELDLAVPAIERGAALGPASGVCRVASCAERARVVAAAVASVS
jgi:nondiscriminating glutamyl-tRNA synthetase